jgi:hypothetical protein
MSTYPLKKNEVRAPFLGEKILHVVGQDPLGLRLTSEATYNLLLPGLNNVTKRIRYYGFYCWLLDCYARRSGSKDPIYQYNVIRRAEYIIALVMQAEAPDEIQISGSSYAKKVLSDQKLTSYDLATGANLRSGGNEGTYWKNRVGAFGQYYSGAMKMLGLVGATASENPVYARTDSTGTFISGQDLAEAFAEHIPAQAQQLFWNSIIAEKLQKADIEQLFKYFNLAQIQEGSKEQTLYLQMLLAPDYPFPHDQEFTIHRNATLKALLAFFNDKPSEGWGTFLHLNYVQLAQEIADDATLTGWYYYQLNEYWHYASSSILSALLFSLMSVDSQGELEQAPLEEFVLGFANDLKRSFRKSHRAIPATALMAEVLEDEAYEFDDEVQYVERIQTARTEKRYPAMAAEALALIIKLYRRNHKTLPPLREYVWTKHLRRDGNFIEFVKVLLNKQTLTLDEFIVDFLYRQILYRHHHVALRKMGNGQQSTLKFDIENNWIRLIDVIVPQFSGPRIDTLLGMAQDLGLFEPDYSLTPRGLELVA